MTARREKESILLVALVTVLVMPTLFAGTAQAVNSSALRMWSEAPNVVVNAGETADFTIALAASTLFSITVSFSTINLPENWTYSFYLKDLQIQGAHLEAGQTATIQLTVDIPLNAVTGRYEFKVVASGNGLHDSYSFPVSADLPLTLEIQSPRPQAALSLTTTLPDIIAHVGETLSYPITVTNKRNVGDIFVLAVSLPKDWTAAFKATVEGQSQEVNRVYIEGNKAHELILKVTPPIDVEVGKYSIVVMVTSENYQVTASLQLTASVLGSYDIEVTNVNFFTDVIAGGKVDYELKLRNIGGSEITNVRVKITGEVPSGFTVSVNPRAVASMTPNQESAFTFSIEAKSDVSAGSYYIDFEVSSDRTEAQKFSLRVDVQHQVGSVVYIGLIPIIAAVVLFFVYRRIRRR